MVPLVPSSTGLTASVNQFTGSHLAQEAATQKKQHKGMSMWVLTGKAVQIWTAGSFSRWLCTTVYSLVIGRGVGRGSFPETGLLADLKLADLL